MATPTFNKLAVRKELGALIYRLRDGDLDQAIKARIVARHVNNLRDDLPGGPLIDALLSKAGKGDISAVEMLREMLPPTTYGEIPAGTRFCVEADDTVLTKRKDGTQCLSGLMLPHLPADQVVATLVE